MCEYIWRKKRHRTSGLAGRHNLLGRNVGELWNPVCLNCFRLSRGAQNSVILWNVGRIFTFHRERR